MNNYQLRLMHAQDIDSIRDLFARVYGATRNIEEDRWRYLKTETGLAPVILVEEKGKLVGSYAVWPARLVCGGKIVPGGQALDIMVDPAHNGKGLFTKMGEAIFQVLENKGIKLLYGFPNAPAYGGHIHKMNWHHVADVPRYVRLIHPLHRFSLAPQWLKRAVHRVMDWFKPENDAAFQITTEKPEAAMLEKIVTEAKFPKYSCHILRDAHWFAWRYDQSSLLPHEWVSAKKGNELKGFAVFREEKMDGFRIIRISECWGECPALLRHIVRVAHERDCTLVMTVTNLPHMKKPLCRQLFLKLQKKPFIVRALTTVNLPANIHVAKNWHIMSGDFDAM